MKLSRKKTTVALALTLVLMPIVPAEAAAGSSEETAAADFFSNPEINAMIDENYEQVLENGWAELRIPRSLHGITEEDISPNALDVAYRLIDAGYEARIIGGAMRDIVMGTETMDFDVVTNATIRQQQELMQDMTLHSVQTGQEFGYVHYPDEVIDLAQCLNIPAAYEGLDGIPDFDPEQMYSDSFLFDSFERDLPINAIYYDVATGDLVDYHGGLRDIREGIIDSIGDPAAEFASNPPAMIRALRFKARYGFDFSERVEAVMREQAPEMAAVNTPETLRFQMERFWPSGYARASYDNLSEYGVFETVYPAAVEKGGSGDYKEYMSAAADWMDAWTEEGNLLSNDFAMAAILWPAVKDAEDIEARAAEVIARENQVCEIDETQAEHYTAMYAMQESLEQGAAWESSEELMSESAFEDAFELLLIRAQTEDGLEEAAQYWTQIRQEALSVLPEEGR